MTLPSSCPLQAQRFLALVLLPHVRRDIEENKRCHFALYQALKKAAYKPDAFFKVSCVEIQLPAWAMPAGVALAGWPRQIEFPSALRCLPTQL